MKKEYLDKLQQRAIQKAKLLINRPDFQVDVLILRTKWNVPVDGIKNEVDNLKWEKGLDQDTEEYFQQEWPKHRKELEGLNKPKTYGQYKQRVQAINDLAPLNAFGLDIKSILKKNRLNPNWENSIRRYVLFNDINLMSLPVGVTITSRVNNFDPAESRLSISIEEDTTLEDIKKIWPEVMEHQKNLVYKKQKKYQKIPKLERDKRIFELSKEGQSPKTIANTISIEFDDAMDENQTQIVLKRYKKRLNIN